MRRWRRVVVAVALVVVAAVTISVLLWPSGSSPTVAGGKVTLLAPAKRKQLPDVSGATLVPPPSTLSLRASRPQFIDVWASWCVPCQEEAPMLVRLHHRYGSEIRFLGIDVEDTRAAARAFERRYQIRYPSIVDRSASMAAKLGFFGLPTAYLVDGRNRIAAVLIGKQTRSALETGLRRLLAEERRRR